MKKILLNGFMLLLAVPVLINGCRKDLDELKLPVGEPDYNGRWAFPIINTTFTIQDILDELDTNKFFSTNPQGFLTLILSTNTKSLLGEDFITLGDQNFGTGVSFTAMQANAFNLAPSGTTISENRTDEIAFNYGAFEIDSLTLKNGQLAVNLSSNFPEAITIDISFPRLTKNGVPVSISANVNAFGNVNTSVDLNGATGDFTQGVPANFNKLDMDYTLSITKQAGSPPIAPGNSVSINVAFQQTQFRKIFGFFGQDDLGVELDTLESGIFVNSDDGILTFEEPELRLTFFNSYGMAAEITTVNPFIARDNKGNTFPVSLTGGQLPFTIQRATTVGQIASSTFLMNPTNSNIKTLVNNQATDLIYQVTAISNPPSTFPPRNFALDSSKITVKADLELPLHGTAKGFSLKDTTSFAPPDAEDGVEWVQLRIGTFNRFPFEINLQVYALDSNNVAVDSIFDAGNTTILQAAPVGSNGIVNGVASKMVDVTLTQARLDAWHQKGVRNIVVKGSTNTTNAGNTPVKIYPDYNLQLRVSARVQFNYKGK